VKNEKGAGGGRTLLCNRFMASEMKMVDAAGAEIRCRSAVGGCKFSHAKLGTIAIADAKRSVHAMDDNGLKAAMKSKIEELKLMFKQ
jgi:hypothetical protein